MKKLLIIGSQGFIGSYCMQYFKDRYETYGVGIRAESGNNFFLIKDFGADIRKIVQKIEPDFCINASGSANVAFSFSQPQKDFELNVYHVVHLLSAIREFAPACRVVNFSSAAVYGNPRQLPVSENHPVDPLSPYGFHKYQSELIIREYTSWFGLNACSLRVFSGYGPGLKKQLFWDMYSKWKQNKAVELFGSGKESRDFIYISDLAEATSVIMKNAPFRGEAINVASGTEITIRQAAETFATAFGREIMINFNGREKEGDPLHWKADISLLRSLGFAPAVPLETGVKAYTDWLINGSN
ncbi:MAG: NAD-dependent epimerase/dehydratase family protein [Bacteroidota bacterium]